MAVEVEKMKQNSEIVIRDPFVLPDPERHCYWLYGTTANAKDGYPELGFYCYRSSDLENWAGPFPAFTRKDDFWATMHFWAPEVHVWQGRYYMFASFKSDSRRRGTQILAADRPDGPFVPLTEEPVTPPDWECLDGTFYVDEEGKPWIVFCHEWVQITDGSIEAMPLTYDLTRAAGEPVTLFHASEAPFVTPLRGGYVTDGPFLFHHRGELCMIWASFRDNAYVQALAVSSGGKLLGPWEHRALLFEKNGGHGMIFTTFEGARKLVLHQPNSAEAHPVFFDLTMP